MKAPRSCARFCAACIVALGCGGSPAGSGGSAQTNELSLTVAAAPAAGYLNGLFTTVTVCVPGTTNCQTIDSVLVDTGSEGLRILSSQAGGKLSLTLPQENDASGDPIAECNPFVDGYTWGPLQRADIKMGNEQLGSVSIQVIGDPSFPNVPGACSASGGPSENTLQDLGTYGILGVGPFSSDCGSICAQSPTAKNTENPGNVYFACTASGCLPAAVPVTAQVQNPVSLLPTDNNGVVVDLPAIPADGAPSVNGSLFFGIGTRANNGLGSARVLPIDPDTLTFTTIFQGVAYPMSFIDSGSNSIDFLDTALSGIPYCGDIGNGTEFYCPTGTVSLTVVNQGTNGATSPATFSVANTDTLLDNSNNFAFDDLAAPSDATGSMEYFDWGLPFFFGRKVFSAIEGASAPGGKTPYFAY